MTFYDRLTQRLLRRPVESTQYTVDRLRQALCRGGRPTVDGQRRRCVRQRPVRELLRDARVRAPRSAPVPHADRGPARGLRFHRKLVQSAAPTFRTRLPVTHAFRADALDRRSHSARRIDDRRGGRYLGIPLRGAAVSNLESSSPSTESGQLQFVRLVGCRHAAGRLHFT
jgi:hypothetical protein